MISDTRGRESITLTIVAVAVIVLICKFAVEGITITSAITPTEVIITFSSMSAGEFGIAFAAVLAPWLHREWRKDKYKDVD